MWLWLGVQFLGALLSAIGGILVTFNARSAIHEIEAALLIGFGAIVMAVISIGTLIDGRAEETQALLRQILGRTPPER